MSSFTGSYLEEFVKNEVIPAESLPKIEDYFRAISTNSKWTKAVAEHLELDFIENVKDFENSYVVTFSGLTDIQKKLSTENGYLLCKKDVKNINDLQEKIFSNSEHVLVVSYLGATGLEKFDFSRIVLTTEDVLKAYMPDIKKVKEKYSKEEATDYVNSILESAIDVRASDVAITGKTNKYHIDFTVDGKTYLVDTRSIEFMKVCIKILKVRSDMNADSDIPMQDGKMKFSYKGNISSWRVNDLRQEIGSSRLTMRVASYGGTEPKLDNLNFYPKALSLLREASSTELGLTLISGPTGSGKTTTLYATLLELEAKNKDVIITLENPVEDSFEALIQIPVTEKFSYATATKGALRANPDKLLIGEIRDSEDAKAAITAALTGHGAFSTLHIGHWKALESRLEGLGVSIDELLSVVTAIIIQQKIPKLCDNCKILNEKTGFYEANTSLDNKCTVCREYERKADSKKVKGYNKIVPVNQALRFKKFATKLDEDSIEELIDFHECLNYHLMIGNIDLITFYWEAKRIDAAVKKNITIEDIKHNIACSCHDNYIKDPSLQQEGILCD